MRHSEPHLARRPAHRRLVMAGAAAAVAVGLAGCAAGSSPTGPAAGTPAAHSSSSGMGSMTGSAADGQSSGGYGAPAPAPASVPASPAPAQVTVRDFAYQVSGPVRAGSTVTVHNDDRVAHTVTSDTVGQFDVTVPAQGTATFTAPRAAGTYAFHCTFHPYMHGKLVVR